MIRHEESTSKIPSHHLMVFTDLYITWWALLWIVSSLTILFLIFEQPSFPQGAPFLPHTLYSYCINFSSNLTFSDSELSNHFLGSWHVSLFNIFSTTYQFIFVLVILNNKYFVYTFPLVQRSNEITKQSFCISFIRI